MALLNIIFFRSLLSVRLSIFRYWMMIGTFTLAWNREDPLPAVPVVIIVWVPLQHLGRSLRLVLQGFNMRSRWTGDEISLAIMTVETLRAGIL
jgi:hypothetical protein